jgi:hypothetical protein
MVFFFWCEEEAIDYNPKSARKQISGNKKNIHLNLCACILSAGCLPRARGKINFRPSAQDSL